MDGVNYQSKKTPSAYVCAECHATGVKLWRESHTFRPTMLCINCLCKKNNIDVDTVAQDGMRNDEMFGRTDQIGGFLPAVPDEEGQGFWGYTSVPQAGVNWWKQLPLYLY